jgi:hypothetical protein
MAVSVAAGLINLAALSETVARDIRDLPNEPHETFLRWKADVDHVIRGSLLSLDAPWSNYSGHLNDRAMYSLQVCADKLPADDWLVSGSKDNVSSILELHSQVRDLIQSILGMTDVDPEVRDFALRHLPMIDEGLQNITLFGSRALVDALSKMCGHVVNDPETARKTAKRFPKLVAIVEAALTLDRIGHVIGEHVGPVLMWGYQATPQITKAIRLLLP